MRRHVSRNNDVGQIRFGNGCRIVRFTHGVNDVRGRQIPRLHYFDVIHEIAMKKDSVKKRSDCPTNLKTGTEFRLAFCEKTALAGESLPMAGLNRNKLSVPTRFLRACCRDLRRKSEKNSDFVPSQTARPFNNHAQWVLIRKKPTRSSGIPSSLRIGFSRVVSPLTQEDVSEQRRDYSSATTCTVTSAVMSVMRPMVIV